MSPCFVTQTDEVSPWLLAVTAGDRVTRCVLSDDIPMFPLAVIFISCLEEKRADLSLSTKQPDSNHLPSLPPIVLL